MLKKINAYHINIVVVKNYFPILVLSTLLMVSCSVKKEKPELQPVAVDVMVIDSMSGSLTRTYVGEVEEKLSIAVNFPLGGKIQSLHVKDGDYVTEGQLLATVNSESAQNAYNSALATLKQAEDGYRRLKKVYDQGSLPEVKWVEMLTNLEKARSTEQLAKKQLDDCSIYAPVSGVVGGCESHPGSSLLPGEPLLTVYDMSRVSVSFSVPESEIATVVLGREAKVLVPALDNALLVGKITERGVTSDRVAHSYKVKIALPNVRQKLMPGMVCKVYCAQPNSEGIIVPAKIVQTRPEGQSVWVIKNGHAEIRYVHSTEFVSNGILVSEGLQFGDSVVIGGYQKLYTEAPVIVVEN